MTRPRIALLNASCYDGNASRNFRRELDADIDEFDVTEGSVPDHYGYDGVVVSGSPASVYWDEPWIAATREYVSGALEADLSALGICWGHQLIAEALGGTVADMGEFELGYRTVETTTSGRADPIFDGIDPEFTVFTSHGDEVVELPPDAEVLALNDYSIHSFRVDNAVGLQFHPEYDVRTARQVAKGKDHLPDERVQRVLDGISEAAYREAAQAKQVFDNFTREVRRTQVAAD